MSWFGNFCYCSFLVIRDIHKMFSLTDFARFQTNPTWLTDPITQLLDIDIFKLICNYFQIFSFVLQSLDIRKNFINKKAKIVWGAYFKYHCQALPNPSSGWLSVFISSQLNHPMIHQSVRVSKLASIGKVCFGVCHELGTAQPQLVLMNQSIPIQKLN